MAMIAASSQRKSILNSSVVILVDYYVDLALDRRDDAQAARSENESCSH